MRWYGDSNDVVEGKPHLWGVVYGQSRPVFYACKAFMEGTWKQRYIKNQTISDPRPVASFLFWIFYFTDLKRGLFLQAVILVLTTILI